MKWRFDQPTEAEPGEHVFALCVFTESKEIGVRAMERAEVRSKWKSHVFAWQEIEYPTFSIADIGSVVDIYREQQVTVKEQAGLRFSILLTRFGYPVRESQKRNLMSKDQTNHKTESGSTDCSDSEMQIVPDFLGGHYVGHGKVWVPVGTPFGVPIGRNDREGNPIHIGDVLEFDESEFGEKCVFTIELEDGEIVHNGSTADLSNWCVIVTPWNENKALANPKPHR